MYFEFKLTQCQLAITTNDRLYFRILIPLSTVVDEARQLMFQVYKGCLNY